MKEGLLQPLAELPESTRRDLLNKLREVVENGEALPLLEETVRGVFNHPAEGSLLGFNDELQIYFFSPLPRSWTSAVKERATGHRLPPSPPSWIFWMFPTSPQLRRTPFTCWSAPWTVSQWIQ